MTEILRVGEVMRRTGLAKSTIYLKVKQAREGAGPRFPLPVPLGGPHAVGWLASEVDQWIADQVRAARGESPESESVEPSAKSA